MEDPSMRTLDLFAGIGGGSLGLHQAGFETVALCEFDPHAQSVLKSNFPNVPIFPDICHLSADQLPHGIEVIIGGFPCQDISLAGAGEGLAGKRSGLWYEYKRLIHEVKPKYVIIENVAALRSRGLDQVLKDLHALGYDAEWHIIPASVFGLPQLRERLWIIAYPHASGLQGPLLKGDRLPKLDQQEKPSFSSDWLSQWLTSWIRGRIISRGYGLPLGMVREAIKRYGNAMVPAIPEFIGRCILEHERQLNRPQ